MLSKSEVKRIKTAAKKWVKAEAEYQMYTETGCDSFEEGRLMEAAQKARDSFNRLVDSLHLPHDLTPHG